MLKIIDDVIGFGKSRKPQRKTEGTIQGRTGQGMILGSEDDQGEERAQGKCEVKRRKNRSR